MQVPKQDPREYASPQESSTREDIAAWRGSRLQRRQLAVMVRKLARLRKGQPNVTRESLREEALFLIGIGHTPASIDRGK